MLFTWEEVSKWLGVTAYEITLYLISFVIFSIGLALKVDTKFGEEWTWWTVFSPLFIGDALNAYFIIIVFLRMYLEKKIKIAFWRIAWSLIQLILKFLFELLICWKLVDQTMFNYSEVMAPMFILSLFVMIRACQLH